MLKTKTQMKMDNWDIENQNKQILCKKKKKYTKTTSPRTSSVTLIGLLKILLQHLNKNSNKKWNGKKM